MKRALVVLLLTFGQLSVAFAARGTIVRRPQLPAAPEAIVTAARQAAQNAMAAGVPAVQIAVAHRGRVIYSEAFGTIDTSSMMEATSRSVLRAGSVTKQFTAAAILRLVERGALTLDDRIEKYVPEFDPRGRTITIRHLLTHTSGVARDPYPAVLTTAMIVSPFTREQALKSLNGMPFDFAPGSKWKYSNSGFLLLGYAVESITGKAYADFIHEEFALPLGLIDTGVCGTHNLPLLEGYGNFNGNWSKMLSYHTSGMVSSGALCSTAFDLARWAHLLGTGAVVLPASYEAMTTPVSLPSGTVVPYGFGIDVQTFDGQRAIRHGGTVMGFQTFVLHLTEKDIAVSVMVNAYPAPAVANPDAMTAAIAKAAAGAL